MAILNVNNPGDVVLDQAPEPQSPGLPPPVADDVPGMPNLMKTIPVGAQVEAAATAPPPAAPPPPSNPVAAAPQPRFTKVTTPITLDQAPAEPATAAPSGIQKVPAGTNIVLDQVPKTYLQATGDALVRGAIEGGKQVAGAADPFNSQDVPYKTYSSPVKVTNPATGNTATIAGDSTPPGDDVDQVINGPIWRGDVKNTIGGLVVKSAHNIAEMSPSLGLGIAGGIGGGYAGGAIAGAPGAAVGSLAGGAAGFGAGSALQEIKPAYLRAMADGLPQDQAIDRAIKETVVSGGFGVLAALLPEVKFFGKSWQLAGVGTDGVGQMVNMARKPVTEALVQMGVAQPAVGAAQQAVDANIENKPLTAGDLESGYVNNAVVGGVLTGLHGIKNTIIPETKPVDNPMQSAPGAGGGARPEPPIYDADVVTPPKKIAGPDNGQAAPDTGNPPPQPAPGGGVNVTVDVPLSRDDLANAINNKTPLPTKKTITLPDVPIAPELQAQGFTVGNRVQQVTDDGEVHEGTIASARAGEDGTEVTMLDDHGNLRTLFSTDGPITAAKVPPAASQPAAPVSAPPAPTSAATAPPAPRAAPAAPPTRAEDLYGQMDLPALKNSLDFVNNHGKVNGWNKSSSATKRAITEQLNARFPEWDMPGRVDVANAAAEVAAAPTDAQKEAGNYQKGHVSIQGLPVTLETVKGQIRSGVGPDGKPWQVPMPAHYGYIKRTTGADDEHVDVYVGNNPSAKDVYVVDQIDHNANKFDEHKALIGFSSLDEALKTYQQAFSDGHGAARMGGVSTMSVQEFKQWLKKPGARRSPLAWTSIKTPPAKPEEFQKPTYDMARQNLGSSLDDVKGKSRDGLVSMILKLQDQSVAPDPLAWQTIRAMRVASQLKDSGNSAQIGKMVDRAANIANKYKNILEKDRGAAAPESLKDAVDILFDETEKAIEFLKSKGAKDEPASVTEENKPAPQQPKSAATSEKNAPEQQQKTLEKANPFVGMSKEDFMGKYKITPDSNAKSLVPKETLNLKEQPKEPFLGGKYTARYETGFKNGDAAVYDGDKVIASYNSGNLVVNKDYRGQGIAEELVYQSRVRNPSTANEAAKANGNSGYIGRTKAAQAIQDRVWNRIQREISSQKEPEQQPDTVKTYDKLEKYPEGEEYSGVTKDMNKSVDWVNSLKPDQRAYLEEQKPYGISPRNFIGNTAGDAVKALQYMKDIVEYFDKNQHGQNAENVNQNSESKPAETASDKNQAVAASSEVDKSTEKPTEAENGAVRQGEVQAGIPDRVGGAEAAPITKDDEGQNAAGAPQGKGGGGGTGVSTRGSVPDEGTQHGSGAGAESGVGNSAALNDSVPESINKPEPAKEKIEDFGQKLAGAKKDIWKEYKDAFSEDLPTDPNEITMAKHFPEPDYANLIENGVSIQDLATIKAMRDTIPAKPRKSWKLKDWAGKVTALREFAADILNGKTNSDKVIAGMKGFSSGLNSLAGQIELYKELGYPAFTKADGWKIGHGSYSVYAGQKFDPPKSMWSLAKGSSFGTAHETRADAVNTLREKLMAEIDAGPQAKKTTLDLFSDRRTGKYFIGKKLAAGKVIRLKEGFDSAKEARTYLRDNEAALISDLEKRKEVPSERRNTNEPRVGKDYRGTEDATPEKFAGEFGFRGVQFGNYVEQGKRAVDLNDAYDGLKDMASIVGVPSRAISLDGTLGLAFGARGSGGKRAAKAHYEPDNIVINLTKSSGAGSLGHEWFHALDNNFGKRSGDSFITENPRYTPEVRKEVTDAFKGVVDAISKTGLRQRSKQLDMTRSKDYWSTTIEMGARAFEAYLIHRAAAKGEANDYLANIVGHEAWKALYADDKNTESYPYPTDEEMEKHIAPAFDKLFSTMKTEETSNGNVTMYSLGNKAADRLQSTLLKTASAMRQGKGTGDQILGYLRKQAGVKEEEIAWTGLDDFLKGKTGVTKEDVVNYLNENQVRVEEVTLSGHNIDDLERSSVDEEDGRFITYDPEGREIGRFDSYLEAEEAGHDYDDEVEKGAQGTKFSQYTLPGGENYREVLLTLPSETKALDDEMDAINALATKENRHLNQQEEEKARSLYQKRGKLRPDFSHTGHFDQPNVLAHIRLNDRTDADGKKVLFVEEIQSDWHQKGRKQGYFEPGAEDHYVSNPNSGNITEAFSSREAAQEYLDALPASLKEKVKIVSRPRPRDGGVPDAPFKKTWQEMAFRRVTQMAAQGGYDRVAWTTGDQQNDRFDLSKKIKRITFDDNNSGGIGKPDMAGEPDRGTLVAYDHDGKKVIDKFIHNPQEIENYIGKDAAEKLLNAKPTEAREAGMGMRRKEISGLDLKVGGEGMKGFYDKIIPQYAGKFGKKFGATVGESRFETGQKEREPTWTQTDDDIGKPEFTAHSMDITPAMRESADAGFELFKQKDANLPATQETVRAGDIQAAINEQMKKQGYTDSNVKLFSSPEETGIEGMDAGAEGVYHNGIIHISMDAADPLKVLDHETIHELKAAGAFTPAEWKTLEAKAGEWRKNYKIDDNYADHDLSDRQLNEEGIAHAFQDHKVQGPVRRIINRVLNFFKAIRDFLRGKGFNFKSAEDIFDSVAKGDVSKRESAQRGREEIKNREAVRAGEETEEDFPKYDLGKTKGPALDEAKDSLSKVKGLGRTLISDIKRVSAAILHPHQIATLYKEFTPVYRAVIQRYKDREVLTHQLSSLIDPYNRLNAEGKKGVDAALEIGRLTGETFKAADDGTITVKNDGLEHTVHSKDGDTVTLTPTEAKAYKGVRDMLNTALDKYKETILEEAGLLDKGITSAQDVEKLRAKAVQDGDVDQVRNLKNVLQRLNDVDSAKKKGYVPFKRWGDIGISVKNEDGDTVHFEKVQTSRRDRKKGYIGESKAVQAAIERLTKQYPGDEHAIHAFEMSKFDDVKAHVDLRALDILAHSSDMPASEYERLREMLEKEMQKKGYRSHFFKAKDVLGYSDDFERAINDYVVTISSYISRRLNNRKIEDSVANVATTGKQKLHEYAKNYVDYVSSPEEELAQIRMLGFTWYLAGNLSSGLSYLTQPLMLTAPWFSAKFGHIEIGKAMTKGYADAIKMIDIPKMGANAFDFSKAPDDVRAGLIKAQNEGEFMSTGTNDAMAISSTSQSLRGLDKGRRTVSNALAAPFSIAERTNRVVTWMSAYRLAMKPGAQDKIRAFIKKDELGRAMLQGKNTPEAFAQAYADLAVVSTQFRHGKLNRPQMARGFGSLVFQFQSWTMQALELLYKLNKVNGGKNYKALAAIILSVTALAGVKGLPFEEDAKNLIEALFKFTTKKDLDIETDVRAAIIKYTHSAVVAEALIKGVPAALLNIDMSNRLGIGSSAGADLFHGGLGPWADILYKQPMQAAKDAADGQYLQALADVAPQFIHNPLEAYIWSHDGVRTQSGNKVIDASKVSEADAGLKAIGFTPSSVSDKRDASYAESRANTAVNDLRSSYTSQIARLIVANAKLYDDKGQLLPGATQKQSDQISSEINSKFDEMNRNNQDEPLYKQVYLTRAAIKQQVLKEMEGSDAMKPRKQAREEVQNIKNTYNAQ